MREIVANIPKSEGLSFCEPCVKGKQHRKPFQSLREIRSTRKLQCIHSDVCGPMPTESLGGKKYFVSFIDDYTRHCSIYLMRNKSEVPDKFKEFEALVCNQTGLTIGTLRSDNGGEYLSNDFEEYLKEKGIRHECTIPYSPAQNGVANRTIVESARTMISCAGLPQSYWGEAVVTAAFIRNRVPTRTFKEKVSPYERWFGRRPDLSPLKIFGCVAYAHIPDCKRNKLDKKAVKLRFVGYCSKSKSYRLFDEKTKKLIVSRDVTFNEDDFNIKDEEKKSIKTDIQVEEEGEQNPQERSPYPDRQRRPPTRYGTDEFIESAINTSETDVHVPEDIVEAHKIPEWKAAADAEYGALLDNGTWELTQLPDGRKPIECKWIFKVKKGSDGGIQRFKARLVAKGYAQKYGVDYDETFAPVVRYSSIRTLLSLAIQNDMMIHQMDVPTAILNGTLEEEIYMHQPTGYVEPGKENLVCRLNKSLYGLKQSPRCWNKAFKEHMKSIKFIQSTADPCIFIKTGGVNELVIVAVYVDDLIIVTKNPQNMADVKEELMQRFKMKDLGKLHHCLGMVINHDEEKGCLLIHQKPYIESMLKRFGLSEAKSVSTPANLSVKMKKDDESKKLADPTLYQSIVGSLLYLAIATRPDISQAVHGSSIKILFMSYRNTPNCC